MKVSHSNIEEKIFGYFEGYLSDSEKADLLDFIHLNPEYEKDFVQWAQTYTPADEEVPDYGIATLLLKNVPAISLKHIIAEVSVLLCLTLYFTLLSPEKQFSAAISNNAPKKKIRETNKQVKISAQKTEAKVQIPTVQSSKQLFTKQLIEEPVMDSVTNTTEAHVQTNDAIIEILLPVQEHTNHAVAKSDSISFSTQAIDKSGKKAETKKRRKRLPLNLKPSPDFMPLNENF